jgi:hypothetical protein
VGGRIMKLVKAQEFENRIFKYNQVLNPLLNRVENGDNSITLEEVNTVKKLMKLTIEQKRMIRNLENSNERTTKRTDRIERKILKLCKDTNSDVSKYL